jgi:hypothetical protein
LSKKIDNFHNQNMQFPQISCSKIVLTVCEWYYITTYLVYFPSTCWTASYFEETSLAFRLYGSAWFKHWYCENLYWISAWLDMHTNEELIAHFLYQWWYYKKQYYTADGNYVKMWIFDIFYTFIRFQSK